jgi:hypothetical protein
MENPSNPNISRLSSNNSLVGGSHWSDSSLNSANKKSAEVLRLELESLPAIIHLNRIVTFTVTFANPVPVRKVRERLITRAVNNLFKRYFTFGVTVFDRSKKGRPHYHIIAVGPDSANFRGAFDFAAWDQSCAAAQRWDDSGRMDQSTEALMRDATRRYSISSTPDLRTLWALLRHEAERSGLGWVNAIPVRNPVAFSKYYARCVTNVFRMKIPEDKGLRRFRFWGDYPRTVTGRFTRRTRGATRWRGSLAFCGQVLGFNDMDDFKKCFGPKWFIFLKGVIRTVPTQIADVSLLSPNIPLQLLRQHRSQIRKLEVELLDRLDRYGRVVTPRNDL